MVPPRLQVFDGIAEASLTHLAKTIAVVGVHVVPHVAHQYSHQCGGPYILSPLVDETGHGMAASATEQARSVRLCVFGVAGDLEGIRYPRVTVRKHRNTLLSTERDRRFVTEFPSDSFIGLESFVGQRDPGPPARWVEPEFNATC